MVPRGTSLYTIKKNNIHAFIYAIEMYFYFILFHFLHKLSNFLAGHHWPLLKDTPFLPWAVVHVPSASCISILDRLSEFLLIPFPIQSASQFYLKPELTLIRILRQKQLPYQTKDISILDRLSEFLWIHLPIENATRVYLKPELTLLQILIRQKQLLYQLINLGGAGKAFWCVTHFFVFLFFCFFVFLFF